MMMSPITRLLKFIKLERQDLKILPILIFGYGLISIATPVSVQALVNIVTMGTVLQPLYVISLILFLLLLLSGGLYVFESYIVELIQRRIFIRTAIETSQNTRGVDIQLYDQENPVELINRFFDVGTVQKSIATLLTTGLTALLQIIIGSLILIFYSAYLAMLILFVIGALILILRSLSKHATETAITESKAKYAMASWLENIAKNILAFKFYQGESRSVDQAHTLIKKYINSRSKHFNILLWQNISAALIYALGGTALLALGGGLVIRGEINLGQFVAAELIIFGVLGALVRLVSKLDYFYDLLAALDKIGVLEDMPQEKNGMHQLENVQVNTLKAVDIHFRYNEFIHLLQGITFELNKGQDLAILGNPGTGKSSLLKLIAKLRTPANGHLTLNQIDIRQIDNNSVRNLMGLAGDIEIIEGSILDNICLGRTIGIDEVNAMMHALGLAEEFNRLPEGISTAIAACGSPLSNSQLQRLMIARAAIGKPSILMIDGILDSFNETELKTVMQMFKKHQQEWMLIVTTRFAHIAKHFDQTLNLNKVD